jgi:hypothetical protein
MGVENKCSATITQSRWRDGQSKGGVFMDCHRCDLYTSKFGDFNSETDSPVLQMREEVRLVCGKWNEERIDGEVMPDSFLPDKLQPTEKPPES